MQTAKLKTLNTKIDLYGNIIVLAKDLLKDKIDLFYRHWFWNVLIQVVQDMESTVHHVHKTHCYVNQRVISFFFQINVWYLFMIEKWHQDMFPIKDVRYLNPSWLGDLWKSILGWRFEQFKELFFHNFLFYVISNENDYFEIG